MRKMLARIGGWLISFEYVVNDPRSVALHDARLRMQSAEREARRLKLKIIQTELRAKYALFGI